jgi:radical SAM superfamily enzyme YgiQ (UPF0313 family)
MGIEKAQAGRLQQLRKRLTPEIARQACERVSSFGMRAAATFILGGPGETINEVVETVSFALSLPLDFAHFNPLAVYPGTTLFAEVFGEPRTKDWLTLCLDQQLAPLGDILWRNRDLPLEVILGAVAEAYRSFYSIERLNKVLSRVPRAEQVAVHSAYNLLGSHRAESWPLPGTPETPPEQGVPLQC